MSAFSSVANAATDAFTSVATDIREDPELLNYMVAGFGPGGVANGFSGYDSNRLVKSPPSSFQASSSSTSPRSRGFKGSQNRHTVGLGLMNPHARNRNRYSPGHDRNHAEPQGLSSGFININPPPGSGTPRFPTQAYSHSNSYSNFDVYGLSQGVRNHLDNSFPTSRKRGWVPALSEPGCTSANEDFMTGFFDAPMHRNANDVGDRASQPAFSHDGRGVGDRRKWDDEVEDENENAMEAGEFFTLRFSSTLCFHLSSPPEFFWSVFVRSFLTAGEVSRDRGEKKVITLMDSNALPFHPSHVTDARGPPLPFPLTLYSHLPTSNFLHE